MQRGKSLQEKHQEYLAKLQERNQAQRLLKEADERSRDPQRQREQGFSVCFSGANSTKRGPLRRHSVGCNGGGDRYSLGAQMRNYDDAGAWGRHWEEHTVEIRGHGGEVYAIRPTGERANCISPEELLPSSSAVASDQPVRITMTREQHVDSLAYPKYSPESSLDTHAILAAVAEQSSSPSAVDDGTQEMSGSLHATVTLPAKSPSSLAATEAKEKALTLLRLHRQAASTGQSFTAGLGLDLDIDLANADGCSPLQQVLPTEADEERAVLEKTLLDVVTPRVREVATPPREESASGSKIAALSARELLPVSNGESMVAEELVDPSALAERIAKLPVSWRASLLRHLEEAEADVQASAFAASIAASTIGQPKSPVTVSGGQGLRPCSSHSSPPAVQCDDSGISFPTQQALGLESPPMF